MFIDSHRWATHYLNVFNSNLGNTGQPPSEEGRPPDSRPSPSPYGQHGYVLSDEEEAVASRRQWRFWGLILALSVASVGYRLLEYGELKQTSLMFIGVPSLISGVMVMLPKAKSGLGLVLTTTTLFMLLSAIVLGEGAICIAMASPLVYFVVVAFYGCLNGPPESGAS